MVRLLMSAALVAASLTVAHADPAAGPPPPHHHHAKKAVPAAAAAPAEDPSIPDQMRGWFEGAVGNILSGADPDEGKTTPGKK